MLIEAFLRHRARSRPSTGAPPGERGIAPGLASTPLQIGTAAGLVVLVGIATADLDGAGASTIAGGLRTGLYVIAAGALVVIPAALALRAQLGAERRRGLP